MRTVNSPKPSCQAATGARGRSYMEGTIRRGSQGGLRVPYLRTDIGAMRGICCPSSRRAVNCTTYLPAGIRVPLVP